MTETMTLTHASGLKYQLFMTARIGEAMQDEKTQRAIIEAVQRFNAGDWGKVPDEDKAANDQDMKHRDGHALGRYGTPGGDIYINLLFWEPSLESAYAMIMFPDEY